MDRLDLNGDRLRFLQIELGDTRVYAQPYYVLRKTKFYAAVKKGVCAPSYVIPKLYLNL